MKKGLNFMKLSILIKAKSLSIYTAEIFALTRTNISPKSKPYLIENKIIDHGKTGIKKSSETFHSN